MMKIYKNMILTGASALMLMGCNSTTTGDTLVSCENIPTPVIKTCANQLLSEEIYTSDLEFIMLSTIPLTDRNTFIYLVDNSRIIPLPLPTDVNVTTGTAITLTTTIIDDSTRVVNCSHYVGDDSIVNVEKFKCLADNYGG